MVLYRLLFNYSVNKAIAASAQSSANTSMVPSTSSLTPPIRFCAHNATGAPMKVVERMTKSIAMAQVEKIWQNIKGHKEFL